MVNIPDFKTPVRKGEIVVFPVSLMLTTGKQTELDVDFKLGNSKIDISILGYSYNKVKESIFVCLFVCTEGSC